MRIIVTLAAVLAFAGLARAETPVERGQYLVTIAGCSDCHTPGALLGQPDVKRRFAGSDTGFGDLASGVVVGQNLTSDPETGIGKWTTEQIVTSFTKGVTPQGRKLSEVMPWPALSKLTPDDARDIALYLQSLPPVKNAVPGPTKPGETPAVAYVSVVIPTAQLKDLPQPK